MSPSDVSPSPAAGPVAVDPAGGLTVRGACHCGAVEFVAEVDPAGATACHCTDCQRLSATAFRAVAPAWPGTLRITRGVPKQYVKVAESGRRRVQAFCGDCGSALYAGPVDGEAGPVMVRTGVTDRAAELRPRRQIWTRSTLPWLAELDGVDAFTTVPPAPPPR